MRTHRHVFWASLVIWGLSTVSWAQSAPQEHKWSRGTTINGFTGVMADSSQAMPALGGALGWETTPRVALEGAATWLYRGNGADGFTGALKVRVGLLDSRTAVPFLQAGVGLHHASFDRTRSTIPDFYLRRIGHVVTEGTIAAFTDPSLVFGGGVNMFLNRHFALRPDVEVAVVMHDGRGFLTTTAGVHLAYHFEDHPVTAVRAR